MIGARSGLRPIVAIRPCSLSAWLIERLRRAAAWTVFAAMLSCCSPTAVGGSPIVGAFERLARHNDVTVEIAGQTLLTELSCTACHTPSSRLAKNYAPKYGPDLSGVAHRVKLEWIRQFLASPQQVAPGTTMPDMLANIADAQRSQAIDALVAYLQTQRLPYQDVKASGAYPVLHEFWNEGDPHSGRVAYHRLGCVACHDPDAEHEVNQPATTDLDALVEELDAEELRQLGISGAARRTASIPFADLRAKYTRRGLTYFLMNPHDVRPSGRMPDFGLKAMEAADLSAYLIDRDTRRNSKTLKDARNANLPIGSSGQLAERGKQLFRDLRCARCHRTQQELESPGAAALSDLAADLTPALTASEPNCWNPVGRKTSTLR